MGEKQVISFGEAVDAMKRGKRVARIGWNGKGLFVFKQVPSKIPMETVPNMQSLPQSVKDEFVARWKDHKRDWKIDPIKFNHIKYENQYAMVYPDNTIYGWVASPSDISENDWIILD